jgi:DNA helicase II / ATP-dependent DNA helicase PcrA
VCFCTSKKIIAKSLKTHQAFLDKKRIELKGATVLSMISKAKSKGLTPEGMLSATGVTRNGKVSNDLPRIVSEIYAE